MLRSLLKRTIAMGKQLRFYYIKFADNFFNSHLVAIPLRAAAFHPSNSSLLDRTAAEKKSASNIYSHDLSFDRKLHDCRDALNVPRRPPSSEFKQSPFLFCRGATIQAKYT